MTKETYTGLSETPWKQRKYSYNSDFKHKKKGTSKQETTFSKYVWTLKDPENCNIEPKPRVTTPSQESASCAWKKVIFYCSKLKLPAWTKEMKYSHLVPKFKLLANAKITFDLLKKQYCTTHFLAPPGAQEVLIFIRSSVRPFIHSSICLSVRPFAHSFVRLSVRSKLVNM